MPSAAESPFFSDDQVDIFRRGAYRTRDFSLSHSAASVQFHPGSTSFPGALFNPGKLPSSGTGRKFVGFCSDYHIHPGALCAACATCAVPILLTTAPFTVTASAPTITRSTSLITDLTAESTINIVFIPASLSVLMVTSPGLCGRTSVA